MPRKIQKSPSGYSSLGDFTLAFSNKPLSWEFTPIEVLKWELYIIYIRIEVELNQVPQCVRKVDLSEV